MWEIERELAGKPERCALKVVGVPPEEGWDDSLSLGYDEDTLSTTYSSRADSMLGEYQLMAGLSHPNVVSVRDVAKVARRGGPGYDVLIRMELLTPLMLWVRGRATYLSISAAGSCRPAVHQKITAQSIQPRSVSLPFG